MNLADKKILAKWMNLPTETTWAFDFSKWCPDNKHEHFLMVLKHVIKKGLKPKVYAALENQNLPENLLPQNMGFFDTILFGYQHMEIIVSAVLEVIKEGKL